MGYHSVPAWGGCGDCGSLEAALGCSALRASRVIVPVLRQSSTSQALGEPFPRTPAVILWGFASRLGFVDELRQSQIAHSREMTAGIHVRKEAACFFLSAVRHEPWIVSPG